MAGLLVVAALVYVLRTPPPRVVPQPVCAANLRDVTPPPLSDKVSYAWRLGRRVGFPVVHGRIAACDVGVFLDTGVSAPLMMSWFADRLGVRRTSTDAAAFDLGGHQGAVEATDDVVIALDSIGIDSHTSAVTAPRGDLFKYGIAAIVPPQLAVSKGRVVALDFGDGTYRRLASRDEADALTRSRGASFEVESRCDAIIHVPLAIEGRSASFAVDTGSPITVLYSESDAGHPIAARIQHWEKQESTYGGSVDHIELPNVPVAIGGMAGLMWMDVWKSPGHVGAPCGFDGVLGVDFLVDHHCLLLFELGNEVGDSGLYYPKTRGFCRP